MVLNGKLVERLKVVIDLDHRYTLFELHVLSRCTNKVFVSVNMQNRNRNSLIDKCFHDSNIKFAGLKSIEGNWCLALIEEVIAFILDLIWRHLLSILASLHEVVLILIYSMLGKKLGIIILQNFLTLLEKLVLLQELLDYLEVWIAHMMILLQKFVSLSKIFPGSNLQEKTKICQDECW